MHARQYGMPECCNDSHSKESDGFKEAGSRGKVYMQVEITKAEHIQQQGTLTPWDRHH